MSRRALTIALIAAVIFVAECVRAQTKPSAKSSAPVSIDELRQMFADGQYRDVIKQAAKIFALRGEAARVYSAHDVTLLKAESHLRLRELSLAMDSFDGAAGVAPDPRGAAIARATVFLIQNSKRSGYVPKSPTGDASDKPIDILEPASRELAFRALFADEMVDARAKLDRVKESDLLPPTLDAIEHVSRLGMIEQAANDSDAESSKLLSPLSKRAKSMMKQEIKHRQKRVDQIEKAANKKKKIASTYRKQGLSPHDPDALREVMQACVRITDACQRLAQSILNEAEDFDEIRLDAQRTGKHAEQVLSADYTGNFDRP